MWLGKGFGVAKGKQATSAVHNTMHLLPLPSPLQPMKPARCFFLT